MKPIAFKDQNIVFAKDQPEYQPLPALRLDTPEGEVISCWKMSIWERLKVLTTGKVWVSLMSFNKPLTPSYISVHRKEVYSRPGDKDLKQLVKKNMKLFRELRNKHSSV